MSDPPLTPLEIERAIDALARQRAIRREPWEGEHLQRAFGRSVRPLRSTLRRLTALGLVDLQPDGRWGLTRRGAEVIDARVAGDWEPLTALTLRAGNVEREILAFLAEATTVDGQARLARARTRTLAPTLAAVLDWQDAWRTGREFAVPLGVLEVAMATAAMEIADGRPRWIEERERVGHRAEAYSLRLERERCGPDAILHVSRDEGDHFGYDLEDISAQPPRLIECKGSRSSALRFVMSSHELEIARRHPDRYEIHYWGEISLRRTPGEDYLALRAASYPIVIPDPGGAISRGELSAVPATWTVTDAAS